MRALIELRSQPRRAARAVEAWFLGPADARAYAALRIGYAAAALCVLVDLFRFRFMLLSSTGLFGGATAGVQLVPLNVFSLARSEALVTAVMVVVGAAVVCLGLGVLPRLAAVVTYVWTLSYGSTAPVSQSGFDTILRVVGFVMVIVPTYGPWRLLGARTEAPPPAYGLRLVQWQVLLIYLSTVWLKAPDPFWRNGEAVTYFLVSMFARFPDSSVTEIGPIGALFDYGTLLIEISVPFLLWMRKMRWVGVLLGVLLHVGIAITSKIALFSVTMLALYAAYLETDDFVALARWFGPGSGEAADSP